MIDRRLDSSTIGIIREAWSSLSSRFKKVGDEEHWTDNEVDTGFLKDIDALNTFLEPYLLAPTSFIDPPIHQDDVLKHLERLINEVEENSRKNNLPSNPDKNNLYYGFSSAPYPYAETGTDFVDSAASLIQLFCNVFDFVKITNSTIPINLNEKMAKMLSSAVDFLLSSKVEDRNGTRWLGISKEFDPSGKYANLFFTHIASMALRRILNTSSALRCLTTKQIESINNALQLVPIWVVSQYDKATKMFWMDANKSSAQTLGVTYATEMLYALSETLTPQVKAACTESIYSVVSKIKDLPSASELQTDFFHAIPLPGSGTMSYDDRRYIGSLLSCFALAKLKDPDIVNDDFVRAGELLWQGVKNEWIDEPTKLWDDGRPLICFTKDAIIGLINYSLGGVVGTVTLRENDLRNAIRMALQSDDVVHSLFASILEKARLESERSFSDKLSKSEPK